MSSLMSRQHHHHNQARPFKELRSPVRDPVSAVCSAGAMMGAREVGGGEGAARRWSQRRLRSWLRHERQRVAMTMAEFKHHVLNRT